MDNAMLNILKGFNNVEKKTLQESAIAECPPMGMDAGMDAQGGEISIKLDDTAQMAKLLMAMQAVTSGSVRDMQPQALPAPEEVEEGGMKDAVTDMQERLHDFAREIQRGMHGYDDVVDELNDMFDEVVDMGDPIVMNAFKVLRTLEPEDFGEGEGGGPNRASMVAQDAMDVIDGSDDSDYDHLEGYTNEPEEEYMDTPDILPSGDDLHRQKDMKAIRVKDPAVETASIKDRLWAALNEKKKSPAGGPGCWNGKKIHPTKPTKMKGGKRVNNCIDDGK